MKHSYFLITLFAALCINVSAVWAADSDVKDLLSNEFYEPGFVQKMIDGSAFGGQEFDQASDVEDRGVKNESKGEEVEEVNKGEGFEELQDTTLEGAEDTTTPGQKILSVSLIVNSAKPEHAAKYIRKLSALSEKVSAKIKKIYLVGDSYAKLKAAKVFDQMSKDFPLISPRDSVPAEYQISKSPTWIFEVDQGEILVEGLDDPKKVLENNSISSIFQPADIN